MSADSGRQIIDRLLGTVALQQSEIESLRAEVDELRAALQRRSDSSFVGTYRPSPDAEIYRAWAANALKGKPA